jgi:RNA polymerase sigma-70 factor (ECF subfamily)
MNLATKEAKRHAERMEPSDSYGTVKRNDETIQADFKALVLRNKAMIWHVCSNYSIGRAWKMEDCMQEVMMNLWRSFGSFEKRSSEKTWVWRVATNTMLMLRRKDVRSPQTESMEIADVEDKMESSSDERYQQLQQLINALPEKSGIIIRAFLDGFSYKEIAEMTGNSVGAVAMRIARTKRKLKKMYEGENDI